MENSNGKTCSAWSFVQPQWLVMGEPDRVFIPACLHQKSVYSTVYTVQYIVCACSVV